MGGVLLKHPSREREWCDTAHLIRTAATDEQGHQVRWPDSERVRFTHRSQKFGLFLLREKLHIDSH